MLLDEIDRKTELEIEYEGTSQSAKVRVRFGLFYDGGELITKGTAMGKWDGECSRKDRVIELIEEWILKRYSHEELEDLENEGVHVTCVND